MNYSTCSTVRSCGAFASLSLRTMAAQELNCKLGTQVDSPVYRGHLPEIIQTLYLVQQTDHVRVCHIRLQRTPQLAITAGNTMVTP